MDSLTTAAIVAALLSYHLSIITGVTGGGGGGPTIPAVAFQDDGAGGFDLLIDNTDAPDAYLVDVGGGVIELQTGVSSGLDLVWDGTDVLIQTP